MDAVAALELHIGLPVLGKEALWRQGARGVPGKEGKVARIAAEAARPAGHTVKRLVGHGLSKNPPRGCGRPHRPAAAGR